MLQCWVTAKAENEADDFVWNIANEGTVVEIDI